MSTLSNPLYVNGAFRNVDFPVPYDQDGRETSGIVSLENDPHNLAIRVGRAQTDFDRRRAVHQEVLGSCAGASKLRARIGGNKVLSADAAHITQGPMCDGVAARAHPEDKDVFANINAESYGIVQNRMPHFRTIVPRQYGGEEADTTEHLAIPNRLAEIRPADYLAGRNIGTLMHQSFLRDGMHFERMCHRHGYMCGAVEK